MVTSYPAPRYRQCAVNFVGQGGRRVGKCPTRSELGARWRGVGAALRSVGRRQRSALVFPRHQRLFPCAAIQLSPAVTRDVDQGYHRQRAQSEFRQYSGHRNSFIWSSAGRSRTRNRAMGGIACGSGVPDPLHPFPRKCRAKPRKSGPASYGPPRASVFSCCTCHELENSGVRFCRNAQKPRPDCPADTVQSSGLYRALVGGALVRGMTLLRIAVSIR